ncbi:MAG: hypothetical protein WD066_19535 [Planctomycetaceae bacterium]
MRSDSKAIHASGTIPHRRPRLTVVWLLIIGMAFPGGAAGQDETAPPPGDPLAANDPAAQAALLIEKELLTEPEDNLFRTKLPRYSRALRQGDMQARALIEEGIAWRLKRMSMAKHRQQLPERRRDLLTIDLGTSAKDPVFRQFLLERVVASAKELLDNNYHVRINVAILVSQLSEEEANPLTGEGEKAYAPIADVLLPLLGDASQPIPVRIWAAKGLGRVLRTGELEDRRRHEIATGLIKELTDNPRSHYWYQWRQVEALGGVGLVSFGPDRAFAVDALAKIMVDRDRHPRVRAEAAKQLGRVPLDGNVNLNLLVYGIADLARDLVRQQNARPGEPYWQGCFAAIYFAFQPVDKQEVPRRGGLRLKVENQADLQKFKETIEAVYKLILPVVKAGTGGKMLLPLDPNLGAAIDDWLNENKPSNLSISPGLTPLIINPDVAARPAAD